MSVTLEPPRAMASFMLPQLSSYSGFLLLFYWFYKQNFSISEMFAQIEGL